MLIPRLAQIEGAIFLQGRRAALLADAPRCGKTGSALIGAGLIGAKRILVITTSSGRAVWSAAFSVWAPYLPKPAVVADTKGVPAGDVVIVGWAVLAAPRVHHALMAREWDLIIADESHAAASPDAKRTQALYGPRSLQDAPGASLASRAKRTWCLSGTPVPNAPCDLHPMLRALAPEILLPDEAKGWPDVRHYDAFLDRYCKWRMKRLSRFRSVRVVMGGQREDELRERWAGFSLRRTQQDVGIAAPLCELLPLTISEKQRREIDAATTPELRKILAAADDGSTQSLEMHFGPLRRLTGAMKATALADLVRDELTGGMAKVVLMSFHVSVVELLADELAKFGAIMIHGGTPVAERAASIEAFQTDSRIRVASCQLTACGEAVDLSASDELIFCESSFSAKDMTQAALRITNLSKKVNTRVRVACLSKSIDEALQLVVARKVRSIQNLL